ncbi:hypothetical protein [Telmatospirillum sp. J64-1]|uniref:hypothetical protein n=1 Tax=Telmatospirillum sp. J64-1 TaxID=2502183 RepID=UPI00115F2935|nr:hypothetical protein [Telmatospirillum sp. J64-1]
MSTVQLPPSPPVPAPGATPGGTTVVLPDPPPSVARLQVGAQLLALVAAMSARGLAHLSSEQHGEMSLRLPQPLPEGSKLALQVVSQAPSQTVLRIAAVNDRPVGPAGLPPLPLRAPASPAANPTVPAPHTSAPAAAPTQSAPTPAPSPQGLTALLLRPAPAPGMPVLPVGTILTVRIAALQPPPAGSLAPQPIPTTGSTPSLPTMQPTTPLPNTPGPAIPVTPTSGTPGTPGAAVPGLALGGTPVGATVPAAPQAQAPMPQLPPGQALPGQGPAGQAQPVLPSLPPVLGGTVVAAPPGGSAVVETPLGMVQIAATGLRPGTTITLEMAGLPLPPGAAAPSPAPLAPAPWQALQTMLTALRSTDPAAAQALAQALPQPGPRMAAAMIAFAGALRSPEPRRALGNALGESLLREIRPEGMRALATEFDEMARQADRPAGDWRVTTLPLLNGQTIEPIRLYLRRPADENEDQPSGEADRGMRFVLDLTLSRLGRLQLDGLFKRQARRFDLILRSGNALPEEMRREIMAIFTGTCDALGLVGSAGFQPGGRFADLPAPPAATPLGEGVLA